MAGAATKRIGGSAATFQWRPGGREDLRNATGAGIMNAMLYGEERLKAEAVVRGGHRSFLTGSHLGGPLGIQDAPGTKRAKATVGGFLRRSAYAVVTVDGRQVPGSRSSDGNGNPTPRPGSGIVGQIGFQAPYAEYVDRGTSRMPARPMIAPVVSGLVGAFGGLFKAGFNSYANRAK